MSCRHLLLAGWCLACGGLSLRAADELAAEQVPQLQKLIRPSPGESKWAAIPWLISLPEARKRARAEDKPLFVWRAGGGEALGRA
jgi:hypothetical protein